LLDAAQHYATWAQVDLGVIRENVRRFKSLTATKVMAVVKANAYGHGAVPVAQASLQGGADWCAVARLEEALELRRAGLTCPILILGYLPPAQMDQAIAEGISITIWEAWQVSYLSAAAKRVGRPAQVHLKVDTGMSRLGVQCADAPKLVERVAQAPGLLYEGLFTHYARADEPGVSTTGDQERLFLNLMRQLENAGLRPPLVHAANSAAAQTRLDSLLDAIRLGISMYGLDPSPQVRCPEGVLPALAWKSVLSQVKTLPAGRGISYGHIYVTSRNERIGTIPVGYGDGLRRVTNNQVLIRGQRVAVVGRVCMDQIMVQLDAVPQAQVGDEVVLIGRQADQRISAEEVADQWGTINYEVVCGIAARVPRLYSA
jgi:alanine racemase